MAQAQSYQGLARKWRPQRFEDLVGQEEVARSLQSALRRDKVAHGHMMAGPRGVGKTTAARILAKALNCEQGPTATPCGECDHCRSITIGNDLDVIEIDGASNNSVDNIRELNERIIQASFAARFKVYIIDEVHMLSVPAFNALLKTLEEPPRRVVFIFATTELEKVPETVRSRCVLHNFRRMSAEDIARRLSQVCEGEGVELDPAAGRQVLDLIARSVEGGMRDALVILDQLLAMTDGLPDLDATNRLLGLADQSALTHATDWLVERDAKSLLALIQDLVEKGRSLERFVKGLVAYLRELMLIQADADPALLSASGDALKVAHRQAAAIAPEQLFNILHHLFELEQKLKQSTQARFLVEFTFLRLAAVKPLVPIEEIMQRVGALPEQALSRPSGGEESHPATRRAISPVPIEDARGSAVSAPYGGDHEAKVIPATRAVAVMRESTPGYGDGDAGTSSADLRDREGLLEALSAQLPDASRFLVRYLRQVAQWSMEENCLRLGWDQQASLARRFVEKPENMQVIEQTLSCLIDRAMRVVNQDGTLGPPPTIPAGEAAEPVPRKPPSAPRPVMEDSDPPEPSPQPLPPSPQRAPAAAGRRRAIEKAQAFLDASEDAARRAKLLRDMFGGQIIDEAGQPLPL